MSLKTNLPGLHNTTTNNYHEYNSDYSQKLPSIKTRSTELELSDYVTIPQINKHFDRLSVIIESYQKDLESIRTIGNKCEQSKIESFQTIAATKSSTTFDKFSDRSHYMKRLEDNLKELRSLQRMTAQKSQPEKISIAGNLFLTVKIVSYF